MQYLRATIVTLTVPVGQTKRRDMRTMRRVGLVLTMLTLGLTPALLMGGAVRAAGGITYHVATAGTDSSCAAGQSGATPLRTIGFAVACANSDSTTPVSPDTIVVAGGTYDEHNLNIAANVALLGPSGVTIDGQGNPGLSNPIVNVNGGYTVAINNLTLTDAGSGTALNNYGGTVTFSNGAISDNVGTPPGIPTAGDAIFNQGTMTVRNATVSGNVSTIEGGAIVNLGTMTIANSTVTDNSADCEAGCGGPNFALGGAIANLGGSMTIANSAVTGNSADCTVGCAPNNSATGGGVWNGGVLTITNSTIANNTATCNGANCHDGGAGILNGESTGAPGTLTVRNSQVDRNTASCTGSSCVARGGGISNGFGSTTLQNSQVDRNTASCTGSSCVARGGGIFNLPTTPLGTVTLTNSEVSKNTPDNCEPTGSIAGCTN